MLKRVVPLGLLATLMLAPAATARDQARLLERRVQAIETQALGPGHAAEHELQRRIRRITQRKIARLERDGTDKLQPDNRLVSPRVGGRWARGVELPIVAINSTLMHTGKVLIFAYPARPGRPDPRKRNEGQSLRDVDYSTAFVFDPETGRSREVQPPINPATGRPANIFCAGTSLLPNGDVLVVGGDVGDPTNAQNRGLNTVYTFDPDTERWTDRGRTRQGRWYPTQLQMADGRTVIVAGLPNGDNEGQPDDPDWHFKVNTDVELYSPGGTISRLESFRVDEPADGSMPPLPGQYPHMFWMPSGHALVAGPRKSDTWTFHPSPPGTDAATWGEVPDLPTHRQWAVGTLQPGEPDTGSTAVMLFGGADRDDHEPGGENKQFPAVKSTTIFDEADAGSGWQDGPDMRVARAFANGVLLPDGQTAIVGGGTGEDSSLDLYRWQFTPRQKRIEIYDPERERFTLGNAQAEGRTYHSTALLMPDGRVMSAGDDINGPTGPDSGVITDTAEMWSPPYLFRKGDRPEIKRLPAAVAYGKPFPVGTPSKDVAEAVLIAPGSSTHDTDMSQRVVRLADPVKVKGEGYNLVAPANANLAPPGYYMLFLLDERGVPSEAEFIRLSSDGTTPPLAYPPAPPRPAPTPRPSPTPAAPGGESPPPEASPSASPTPTPANTVPFRVTLAADTVRRTAKTFTVRVDVPRAGTVTVRAAVEGKPEPGEVPLAPIADAEEVSFSAGGSQFVELTLDRRPRKGATIRVLADGTPSYGPAVHASLRVRTR